MVASKTASDILARTELDALLLRAETALALDKVSIPFVRCFTQGF